MQSNITEAEFAQLKCLSRGCAELKNAFLNYSRQTDDPQLHDEFQKLAASAQNHISKIDPKLSGGNKGE